MARRMRLVERREQLGLTQVEVARRAGCNVGTYRSIESGRHTPRPGSRKALADALGWTTPQLHAALSDDLQPVNGHEVPGWLGHLASLEQAAGRLCAFETVGVHGLLQTADYAAAVESVGPDSVSDAEVARKVENRLARQAVLTREPDPLDLAVILDESTLLRVAGNAEVMAVQLDHLAERAEWPNVDLRVLPLDAGTFAFGSFTLFAQPGATKPYMAISEDRWGPQYRPKPPEIDPHLSLFEHLTDLALSPGETLDRLVTTAKEYRR